MATIKYNGEEFEYNDKLLGGSPEAYAFQKRLAKSSTGNPIYMYEVYERLFDGRDEEYAEKLGGIEGLSNLFVAVMEGQDGEAKNSAS